MVGEPGSQPGNWPRHYSDRTEDAYVHWIRRFIFFHGPSKGRERSAGR
ncbi:MAG: phage integrase N-terminal SAM-like domain-containing protein [Acidobacteriota bacterium]